MAPAPFSKTFSYPFSRVRSMQKRVEATPFDVVDVRFDSGFRFVDSHRKGSTVPIEKEIDVRGKGKASRSRGTF